MEDERAEVLEQSLANLLTIGLLSGLIAAGVNIAYLYLYESVSGYSYREEVNFMAVAISSIIPGIFAGMGLFMLSRFFESQVLNIFISTMVIIGLMSIIYPLAGTPEGVSENDRTDFLLLTVPMHVIAIALYIFMLVRAIKK